MPVVVNEFEVVSESSPAPAASAADAASGGKPKKKPEAADLAAPLAILHELKLRVWAH